jgi:hypothetical protein
MVRLSARWPANVSPDAKRLADELINVLQGHDAEVMGPALSVVFAFTMCSIAGRAEDQTSLDQMMSDLTSLILKHGAATTRPMH